MKRSGRRPGSSKACRLIGVTWAVPDFSTLSRRQKTLARRHPYRGSKGPLHLLIESTGLKVEGEGEWRARKHGGPKRRVWRKIHLEIDEETLEIRAVDTEQANATERACERKPYRRRTRPARPARPDPKGSGQRHGRRRLRHAKMPQCNGRPRCPCCHSAAQERETVGPSPLGPWRATRPCGHRSISAVRFGDVEAGLIAEVASRRRRIASSCRVSASWHGPSTARSPNSIRIAILNGYTALGTPRQGSRGISPSGERRTSAITRFVQQGPAKW